MEGIIIRGAKLTDALSIEKLINSYAEKGLMLSRKREVIIESIRNYIVAELGDEIVGCASLSFFTEELAEIRSLAVREDLRGKGIGRKLVLGAEKILKEEGIKKVFVLTYQVEFFKKLGYIIVDKTIFPQKIWRDCLSCSKIMNCDEVAMEKDILS
ncbi:MAG: N-acetyltransferase [Brevinematales bacterium]|nr:N-acetyltransferase [Brevinematales bacterium]